MSESPKNLLKAWKKSRAGAWAGRGFHYQHLVTTLILLRQWAGLAPIGAIVPEGLEDCVIELDRGDLWLQIKSRFEGSFSGAELRNVADQVRTKAAALDDLPAVRARVILEQDVDGQELASLDDLFVDAPFVAVRVDAPQDAMVILFAERLDIAEITAENLVSDLYKLVAEVAQENARLSFQERRRITTTEVEKRIAGHLEAADPSAIDAALLSGALRPIDLHTPLTEPHFYEGVKVAPGHVAAGLVLPRPSETARAIEGLKVRRTVLLSGPSGAGKSALLWLTVSALAAEFRWFQVTAAALANDVQTIIRFLRARRPGPRSPIALAFDEVGVANSGLWDALMPELRSMPDVYCLGSIRQEDVTLIASRADTKFVSVHLDEALAEAVWRKLAETDLTHWVHWREPFEQSGGLMLEYVHILTQGRRLADVIAEQVHARELESREDELAIIRYSSVLCARGGEVHARALFDLVSIPDERASRALKRLLDEHLVRESRPGVLGGLHLLRSRALEEASHDGVVYSTETSFWRALSSTTRETLPHVLQSLLANNEGNHETPLRKLASILVESDRLDVWTAIFTGLGLATLDRAAAEFASILERRGVQRAQWSLAVMFSDPDIEIAEMPDHEAWQRMRAAVLEFRARSKNDLRAACAALLPHSARIPAFPGLMEANEMLSALVPIAGGEAVPLAMDEEIESSENRDVREIAEFLSMARLFDAALADRLATRLGGETHLLERFRDQTPWLGTPTIDPHGEHGRTVRADWFLLAEQYQDDAHETVCGICETLIGLSPRSDAAASNAVLASGEVVQLGSFVPISKNMPRKNLPAKARVAWNVAFKQIFLARFAGGSLTEYASEMASTVRETEKIFRSFSEKWIKSKAIPNRDALADEINGLTARINALSYVAPEKPSHSMAAPKKGTGANDTLGGLLTAVVGNLAPRMGKMPGDELGKATAAFAGGLSAQARDHSRSSIWRVVASPPSEELAALGARLYDVSCILHEMVAESSPVRIATWVAAAKKARMGNGIHAAAHLCRAAADRRLRDRLNNLEEDMRRRGWRARCRIRTIEDDPDTPFWPPNEIALLVELDSFERDAPALEAGLAVAREMIGYDYPYRVAPIVGGQVIGAFALQPSSELGALPDDLFAQRWLGAIEEPILATSVADTFDRAVAACVQVSSILAFRDPSDLQLEEARVLGEVIEDIQRNMAELDAAAARGSDEFAWAAQFIETCWDRLGVEAEAARAGKPIDGALWEDAHAALKGEQTDWMLEVVGAKALLREIEAKQAINQQ
jgi:hypothetical protein